MPTEENAIQVSCRMPNRKYFWRVSGREASEPMWLGHSCPSRHLHSEQDQKCTASSTGISVHRFIAELRQSCRFQSPSQLSQSRHTSLDRAPSRHTLREPPHKLSAPACPF